jgi:hypothetical protein
VGLPAVAHRPADSAAEHVVVPAAAPPTGLAVVAADNRPVSFASTGEYPPAFPFPTSRNRNLL